MFTPVLPASRKQSLASALTVKVMLSVPPAAAARVVPNELEVISLALSALVEFVLTARSNGRLESSVPLKRCALSPAIRRISQRWLLTRVISRPLVGAVLAAIVNGATREASARKIVLENFIRQPSIDLHLMTSATSKMRCGHGARRGPDERFWFRNQTRCPTPRLDSAASMPGQKKICQCRKIATPRAASRGCLSSSYASRQAR